MKTITITAKNLEQAIEQGLQELNTEFENVDINVISEGGIFKKAKIEMTLSKDINFKTEEPKTSKFKENAKPTKNENNDKTDTKTPKTTENSTKITQKQPKIKKTETNTKTKTNSILSETKKEKVTITENKQDQDFEKELKEIESQLKELEKPAKSNKQQEIEKVEELVQEFLNGLIYSFNIVASVETQYKNGTLNTRVVGDNLGFLIGHRGESLDAIQYLVNNLIINKLRSRIKVVLDIENYRKKREDSLRKMATKVANKVQEHRKSLKLEPMTSYERKIIHTHLQTLENIETYSEGKEPKRYLVIKYSDNK